MTQFFLFQAKPSSIFPSAIITCLAFVFVSVGYLPWQVGLLVAVFAFGLFGYCRILLAGKHAHWTFIAWWILLIVGLAIGLYRPENFHYPLLFSEAALHEGGQPYSLYTNIGKALAGYSILFTLGTLIATQPPWINAMKSKIGVAFLCILSTLIMAFILLDLDFFTKSFQYILLFGVVNLIITCVAEEAFMRLFIQNETSRLLKKFSQSRIIIDGGALLVATLIFILTHNTANTEMTIVYAFAGLLYGLIYTLTKNVYFSIAVHFGVNLIHFSFLTYPLPL